MTLFQEQLVVRRILGYARLFHIKVLVFVLLAIIALSLPISKHAILHFSTRISQSSGQTVHLDAHFTVTILADLTIRLIIRVAHAHDVHVRWEPLRFTSTKRRLSCLLMEALG